MATRTAPDATTTATRRIVSFLFIDASGDTFSASEDVPVAATSANIEALADALAAASQASLYGITDTLLRSGDADPDNADTDMRNSVGQGVNILLKVPATGVTKTPRLPAPVPAVMLGNTDQIDPASTELAAVITALLAIQTGYAAQSARYTERREKNKAIKL